MGQGQPDEIAIGDLAEPRAGAPEKLEDRRIGEFRRAAQAAIDLIDEIDDLGREIVQLLPR